MAGTGSRGRAERRGAGELESEVLAALWATGAAADPGGDPAGDRGADSRTTRSTRSSPACTTRGWCCGTPTVGAARTGRPRTRLS
ncbi:hypothetical protein LT493_08635 [Streptomyces tricolor]|nr:hypothetical protein [Streptomyces tricolor]